MELGHELSGSELTIILPSSVSESNAEELKTEINNIMKENPCEALTVDCRSLNYISSSGLRVLLSVQKKMPKGETITLRNVNRNISDILGMTGFDLIFRVIRNVRTVDTSDLECIYSGINGEFYRMSREVMVKAYREGVLLEDVEKERDMTKAAMIAGIPTAISYAIAQTQDFRYGIILEDVHGETLESVFRRNPSEGLIMARRLGRFVYNLHQTQVADSGLPNIKDRYNEWLEKIDSKKLDADKNQLKLVVNQMSDSDTFVHGDLNPGNIIVTSDDFLLMDMSSCGYGHPIFDLQALYATFVAIEIDDPGYCERTFGLTAKQSRDFWKAFLRSYLVAEYSGQEVDGINEKIETSERKFNQLLARYYILKSQLINAL